MKAHPTFEEFAKLLMGEWNKIEYEMDHLESVYTASDMRFATSMAERKRQERIYNVATGCSGMTAKKKMFIN